MAQMKNPILKRMLKAHGLVSKHIKKGGIVRPTACETCGKTCKPEAHYDDYEKPLEVRFLCNKCHKKLHKDMV